MVRYLLLFTALLFTSSLALAQTSLNGKVTIGETGEVVIYGNVAIYKNGVLITGTETDLDGNYNFANMDPGTYDVEASYVGYQSQRVTGVKVFAGRANKLDIQLASSGGISLTEVVVVEYKVPLVEQDNTTQGQVITSDQIKNLPTRNINALAATTAGLASADEGGDITVRGSRSDATNYYVDGIRVQGNLIPESEIDQLQVITGGVESQYGDVTGGIISITTKGPSDKFSGGIEAETSKYLDAFDNNLVGINLSGPIARNKQGVSVLGFRLSGRYTYNVDDDPPATPVFQVKDDVLRELEANPLVRKNDVDFIAADFLDNDDVNVLDARPNETFKRYDITAKIDARFTKAIDMSLSGSFANTNNTFTPGGWRLYNSHNNPTDEGRTYRGNFRFRHRLGGEGGGPGSKPSTIQNANYTLQIGYEKTKYDVADPRHGNNYFDYGYIGKYDIDYIPIFDVDFDQNTGQVFLTHTDYREVLRSYEAGASNPVLANYNLSRGFVSGEDLNPGTIGYGFAGQGEGGVTLDSFAIYNGRTAGVYTTSWNFHSNVGAIYNQVFKSENDIYTFNANASFDLVPGSSDKGRHNIQAGIWYEQRANRSYNVAPRGLWQLGRQLINNHFQGLGTDTIGYVAIPTGLGDSIQAPLLNNLYADNPDNLFYRRVREALNIPITEYVNIDGLDPDQLSLDMFSAKELNDQSLIYNLGYDYLGNPFDGTFEDFFTATDPVTGVRTFPVAPNRPIYTAAYIQDKFTFKDIIFRLGVRVDRYDANTKVLKDNYSLYEISTADEFHANFGGDRPGNIGDDFAVYVADNKVTDNPDIVAYRENDSWFKPDGTPVNSSLDIDEIRSGLVFPWYKNPEARANPTYIKDRNFDVTTSFEDYEVQVNVMPRLAFSFPISTEANFFAHYDILVQRPPTSTIASPRDYFYFTEVSYGANNPISNPNLKPERTVDYEVGFQQKLSNTSALKIAAYYKEMRDMIQQRTFFPVPIVNQYTTYDNLDFGTVKGFSFTYDLRRTGNLSLNANYTLQFADGTGSDANSQRGLTNRGNLRTLFPLNFDERHRFVAAVDYRYGSGKRYTGPELFGKPILANFGVNLQAIAVSGRPYTATQRPVELGGVGFVGDINGARKPWNFTLNMRVDKTFDIGPNLGLNVYVRVSNLLDRRNVINVYSATGSPEDDGFLRSEIGQDQIETFSNSVRPIESYLASYQWALLNPNLYSLPRRIFLGVIFDF